MTDLKLLELAARACGIEVKPIEINNVEFQGDCRFIGLMADVEQWPRGWFNPLTDDGDALRLAVKLSLVVESDSEESCSIVTNTNPSWMPKGSWDVHAVSHNDDPYAATRRAIVRAAAEIGKAMEDQ